MGCRCCRMIKSYIYEPSVPVDVHGYKQDLSSNPSLVPPYQCHRLPEEVDHKKMGFHNMGFTNTTSPTKLDIDNNHINRLHSNNQTRSNHATTGETSVYILQPEGEGVPIRTSSAVVPSAPLIYSIPMLGTDPCKRTERFRDSGLGNGGMTDGNDGSDGYLCGHEDEDEEENRQRRKTAGTPDYVGDTADEESVISVDIHTSSTSLSSTDTKLVLEDRGEGGSSHSSRKNGAEKETEDCISVTDSMVAEALAALEAATAGEDYE